MSEQETMKKYRSLCNLLEETGEDIQYKVEMIANGELIVKDKRCNGFFYSNLCSIIVMWANKNNMAFSFYAPKPCIYLTENE